MTTITLSDSDADNFFPGVMETQQNKKRKEYSENKESNFLVEFSVTTLVEDSEESANEDPAQKRPKDELPPPFDFIPLNLEKENSEKFDETGGASNSSTKVKNESPIFSANFMSLENAQVNGNTSELNLADDTIILSESPPPPDFISLSSRKENENIFDGIEDEIPRPIVNEPKCLRPVVIHGSNVARDDSVPVLMETQKKGKRKQNKKRKKKCFANKKSDLGLGY